MDMINNKKGYSIKELVILCAILAIVFGIAISRVSYAYDKIDNSEEMTKESLKHVEQAAKIYVQDHKEEFKEKETYFYGSDLISSNYLSEGSEIANVKIKVTHDLDKEEYHVEIER